MGNPDQGVETWGLSFFETKLPRKRKQFAKNYSLSHLAQV